MNNNTCLNFNNLIIFDAASFLYITNTSNVIIPNLRFFSVVNDVITESNQSCPNPKGPLIFEKLRNFYMEFRNAMT